MLLQLIPLGYTDNNTKDKWLLKSISKSQQQLTCIIQPINSAANKTTSLYRNVYGLLKKENLISHRKLFTRMSEDYCERYKICADFQILVIYL